MNPFAGLETFAVPIEKFARETKRNHRQHKGSTLRAMFEYIKNRPGCTGHDVACGLGIDPKKIHMNLRQLEKFQGRLRSEIKPAAWYHRGKNATREVKHYWVVK